MLMDMDLDRAKIKTDRSTTTIKNTMIQVVENQIKKLLDLLKTSLMNSIRLANPSFCHR